MAVDFLTIAATTFSMAATGSWELMSMSSESIWRRFEKSFRKLTMVACTSGVSDSEVWVLARSISAPHITQSNVPLQQGLQILRQEIDFCISLEIVTSASNADFGKISTVGKMRNDGLYANNVGCLRDIAYVALFAAVYAYFWVGSQTARFILIAAKESHQGGCFWGEVDC